MRADATRTVEKSLRASRLGLRVRKLFVASVLLTCTWVAWRLVHDPFWDSWWDAYNWPQLFLYSPYLFFFGAVVW